MPFGLGAQGGQSGWDGNAGESLHPLHAVILAAGGVRADGGEDGRYTPLSAALLVSLIINSTSYLPKNYGFRII